MYQSLKFKKKIIANCVYYSKFDKIQCSLLKADQLPTEFDIHYLLD